MRWNVNHLLDRKRTSRQGVVLNDLSTFTHPIMRNRRRLRVKILLLLLNVLQHHLAEDWVLEVLHRLVDKSLSLRFAEHFVIFRGCDDVKAGGPLTIDLRLLN